MIRCRKCLYVCDLVILLSVSVEKMLHSPKAWYDGCDFFLIQKKLELYGIDGASPCQTLLSAYTVFLARFSDVGGKSFQAVLPR